MASMDLWLDGTFTEESSAWRQDVLLNLQRLQEDDEYAERIHLHVQQSLYYLARELEAIDANTPWRNFEPREYHNA